MSDLVLEHLKMIQQSLGDLRLGQRELRDRLATVEGNIGGLRRDYLGVNEGIASLAARLDRHEDRLERIETRLGLIDFPAH